MNCREANGIKKQRASLHGEEQSIHQIGIELINDWQKMQSSIAGEWNAAAGQLIKGDRDCPSHF